jgi:SAM-dependent methyltransferase
MRGRYTPPAQGVDSGGRARQPAAMRAWDPTLVCPRCRALDERGLHVRTLAPAGGDDDAALVCACGARWPIDAGVLRVHDAPLGHAPDEPATRQHLAVYLDAHHGDRAVPPPDGPGAGAGGAEVLAWVRARAAAPVARAVELGCSVGGGLAALAAGASAVVGVDGHLGALRLARRLLDGAAVGYQRSGLGGHLIDAEIAAAAPTPGVTLVCADALDPPLLPGAFDRVVALGLLDSCASPRGLLAVLDGLCAPGGELLLASPFTWPTEAAGELAGDPLLGGPDPAAGLRTLLATGDGLGARYAIEDATEVPWRLRIDGASATLFRCHLVRARRQAA